MNTVGEPFATVLRQAREDFNVRFVRARRSYPKLDAGAFSAFLLNAVDPLVSAVATAKPDAVFETASAGYDVALELAGHGLLGPRYLAIEEGWRSILPTVPMLVAGAPNRVLAAISNALHHLTITPGARVTEWVSNMTRLAPKCVDLEAFLHLGQFASWRAGLAHYRDEAMKLVPLLKPELVLPALGIDSTDAWPAIYGRLQRNPWDDLKRVTPSELRIAAEAGAFRGFGGLFPEPPLVTAANGHFYVTSGDGSWMLTADCFGATFHRATPAEAQPGRSAPPPRNLRVEKDKVIRGSTIKKAETLSLADYGPVTSHVTTLTTLAVTTAYTHAVLLIPLTSE